LKTRLFPGVSVKQLSYALAGKNKRLNGERHDQAVLTSCEQQQPDEDRKMRQTYQSFTVQSLPCVASCPYKNTLFLQSLIQFPESSVGEHLFGRHGG